MNPGVSAINDSAFFPFSVINKKFHICSLYPGFKYLFREKVECGAEKEWKVCRNGDPVPDASEEYEFASSDGDRISRIVK